MSAWVELKLLKNRFTVNVAALATRYPQAAAQLLALTPAEPYHIRPDANRMHLGIGDPVRPLLQTLPPEMAKTLVSNMFPSANCDEAALIAGEDLGWLWNALYQLPCQKVAAPGHRAPLYFLTRNWERLWVMLHLQDWQKMLADPRVRLFIGDDAAAQLQESLREDVMCPWPKLSITVEPDLWPEGVTLEGIIKRAGVAQNADLDLVQEQLKRFITHTTPQQLATRIRKGEPLRILGATSRYTTFLQYSMRDWLAGFDRLGHQTKLLIEEHDHHVPNNLFVAQVCAEFKPDVIIAIDHCRKTLLGVPDDVPVVMWVQDRLPHIYDTKTGLAQGPRDYVIGYARQELSQRFNYPASRFMPAMVGINDQRFVPRALTAGELERYRCDVSFVSHCVTPAAQIIEAELEKLDKPESRALVDDLFQQLQGIYDAGGFVSTGDVLMKMINDTLLARRMTCDRSAMLDLFAHRVNNALFRHQAVRWAAHSGANLHLYGNGWEKHPEFSRFARGVADNQDQLPIIYQASAINLQVTPFGAVHQRLLDGLAAGGFFLLRSVTADDLEVIRKQIWEWCLANQVTSGREMLRKCDDQLTALLFKFQALGVVDPRADIEYVYAGLDEAAISNFERTANTMWKESSKVTFSNQAQFTAQIEHFLANPRDRREIATAMRRRVLETHTYKAISARMLTFIADDIERELKTQPAVAA